MARHVVAGDLSKRTRTVIVVGGVIEGLLEVVSLIDIHRRPAERIRGSKSAWTKTVIMANSVGAVPLAYFLFGRHPHGERAKVGSA